MVTIAPTRSTIMEMPAPSFEIVPEPPCEHEGSRHGISSEAKRLLERYDLLLEDIYRVRKELAEMANVLKNMVTVRYRPDAPPGYGLSHDMSRSEIPDLERLGRVIYDWQLNRKAMVDLMLDPETDEHTARHVDKKLHPRTISCC